MAAYILPPMPLPAAVPPFGGLVGDHGIGGEHLAFILCDRPGTELYRFSDVVPHDLVGKADLARIRFPR